MREREREMNVRTWWVWQVRTLYIANYPSPRMLGSGNLVPRARAYIFFPYNKGWTTCWLPLFIYNFFKANDMLFDVAMTRFLLPSIWTLEVARKLSESWIFTFKIKKNHFNHFSIKKSKNYHINLNKLIYGLKILKNSKITWNHKTSQ
jgi:hypothetical protein